MVIFLEINKGDFVTRKSYNNDTIFKVLNIKDGVYYLKGAEVRLYADSNLNDLVKCNEPKEEDYKNDRSIKEIEKSDYFYLPAKILHIDGDNEYLEKCLKYYKAHGVFAIGKKIKEGLYSPITQNERHRLVVKNLRMAEKNLLERVVFEKTFDNK